MTPDARAQNTIYTWTGAGGSNDAWDYNFYSSRKDRYIYQNWQPNFGTPPSGNRTEINFTGGTSSNQDLGTFTLNALEFDVTGSVFNLRGDALNFVANNLGSNPFINQNHGAAISISNSLILESTLTLGGGGSGNITLSGAISGAGGLVQSGGYTTLLSGSNSYSGGTFLNNGAVVISADNNLGTGALTFNGGNLQFAGNITGDSRNVSLNADATIDTGAYYGIFGGAISGTGALTKTGSGDLALIASQNGNSNTFSGGINLNAGTLTIASLSDLGTGTLNFNGGSLRYGDLNPGGTFANDLVLTANANTLVAGTGIETFSGVLSGASPLNIVDGGSGTGTVVLTGNNTYTGGTNLNGATLSVSSENNLGSGPLSFNGGTLLTAAGLTDSRTITLNSGGGVINPDGNFSIFSGNIGGPGALTITGSGTAVLPGTNTYAGGTNLNGGFLDVESGSSLGAGPLTFNGGQLSFIGDTRNNLIVTNPITLNSSGTVNAQVNSVTFSGNITGSGSLTLGGAYTVILGGNNTSTGGININAGTLSVASESNLGAGTAGLAFANGGTLLLTGNNLSDNRPITLNSGGVITTSGPFIETFNGNIGGSGALTLSGGGQYNLNGSNSYSGGTVISANTQLVFGSAGSLANGPLSGAGTLTKTGGDRLTLSAASPNFTGTFNIDAGTVLYTNAGVFPNATIVLNVNDGLTYNSVFNPVVGGLSGAGALYVGSGGPAGGYLNGGHTPGITIGGNNQDTTYSGVLGSDMYSGNSASTIVNPILSKVGTGTLTLTGNNTFYGPAAQDGINIFGGFISVASDSNLGNASNAIWFQGGGLRITGNNFVDNRNLYVSGQGGTIDTGANNVTLGGVIADLSPSLNAAPSATLTKIGSGTLTITNENNELTFGGHIVVAGGTVVVSDQFALGANSTEINNGATLQFNNDFYANSLAVSTGNINTAAVGGVFNSAINIGNSLTVNGSGQLDFNGTISGPGSLTLTGGGNYTLGANDPNNSALDTHNSYSGGTNVYGGHLYVSTNSAGVLQLGTGPLQLYDNATIQFTGNFAGNITLNSSNDVVDTGTNPNATTTTYSGVVSGAGGLSIIGDGTLILSNINTYTGGNTVTNATLVVAADSNLGAAGSPITLIDGATLELAQSFNSNRNITLNSGAILDANYFQGAGNLSGVISGSGPLTKTGSSTLILSGANTYTGGTIIAAGVLALGANGTLPYGSNLYLTASADNAALDLAGYTQTLGNINLNDGTSTNNASLLDSSANATGLLTLNGDLTYNPAPNGVTAPATVYASLGLSPGQHNITDNPGTPNADGSYNNFSSGYYDLVLAGSISGSGGLNFSSPNGYLALTHTTSYTGPTNLNNAYLYIGATNALPTDTALTIDANSVLDLGPPMAQAGLNTLSGVTPGNYNVQIGSLSGAGQVALGSATLTVGGANTDSTFSGIIADNIPDPNGDGVISAGGSLTKIGTGGLTLSGANTFSGPTTINGGSIVLGNPAALQNSTVVINVDNGLNLNGQSSATLGGLSGTGALNLGNTQLSIGNNNGNASYSGVISGPGAVAAVGTGIQTFAGANTYSGGTSINAGTLVNNGSLASLVTVNAGATAAGTGNDVVGYQLNSGGNLMPGTVTATTQAPGTLSSGSATWNGGGQYTLLIDAATGTAGANWGLNRITGALTINANSNSLFSIAIQSLTANKTPGNLPDFNPAQDYTWTIATTTQGIQGFNPADFTFDTTGFGNPLDGGYFSAFQDGNKLDINFVAATSSVPEGSTLLSAGLMLALGGLLLRRRIAQAA